MTPQPQADGDEPEVLASTGACGETAGAPLASATKPQCELMGYITHEDLPASVKNAIGASPEFGWSGGFIDIEVAIGYRFGGK